VRQTPRGGDSVTSLSANALNAIDASGGCETGRRREVTTTPKKLIEATEGHEGVSLFTTSKFLIKSYGSPGDP
jgi:hypothetical protein